ncbi:MAG: TonB-dependent receptor [Bacteroidota bacterium]|nr:TonB-dependent receptor [Bacteroidota bacterium]
MQSLFLLKRILQIGLMLLLTLFATTWLPAQTLTQTVRGNIVDRQIKSPLPGAIVVLLNVEPARGCASEIDGSFKLEQVPVGRQSFKISLLGYHEIFLNDVEITSGKEVVLNIEMEEEIVQNTEVVITADEEKPLNEMSTVSARTFSVEETQRFAAAVNDPARAALAYAGVTSVGDGNNFISIRGNMPNGLLWRMEGIEVPNPNHFSSAGTAGGGISILSAQLLSNSDFVTGAFAAEYGNATSGVFDLRLRHGNNEKHEFTFQAGVLGIDVAAEGPFSSNHNGSYLVNYRYSTLGILGKLGILGDGGVTTFQDLSYNVVIPTQRFGTFTAFGFGGLSSETYHAQMDSANWKTEGDRYTSKFHANTGVCGFTWGNAINEKTFMKLATVISSTDNGEEADYLLDSYVFRNIYHESYLQQKITLSGTVTHKFNSHHLIRSGVILNQLKYDLSQRYYDDSLNTSVEQIRHRGATQTIQAFTQWQYRPTAKLTLNTGVHALLLLLNNSYSVEPRAAASWAFPKRQTVSAGYGMHSQIQPMGVYFSQQELADGSVVYPNKNLGLLQAHHLVLSYDKSIGQHLHVKTEVYHQWLMNVPVKNSSTSSFAVINQINGVYTDSLTNAGKGRNYGLELTLEKFFSKGSYFILSGSLYNSSYKAMDGVWRNTRFNGQYASTFTGGKEFVLSEKHKRRIIGLNLKVIYAGGFYDTPIDLAKSNEVGGTWKDESRAYSEKMPDYFRIDIRASLKTNHKGWTSTVSLDIQNVTNRKNVFNKYYDADKKEIVYNYQAPLIPVLSYKVQF